MPPTLRQFLGGSQSAKLYRRMRSRIRGPLQQEPSAGRTSSLPADVLELIFEALFEMRNDPENWRLIRPTLGAAARVCQDWHDLATKYLYRDVYLSTTISLRLFRATLELQPRRRPLVRHFCFAYPAFVAGSVRLQDPRDFMPDERRVYGLCPRLEFKCWQWPTDPTAETLEIDLGVNRLTHLVLRGCAPYSLAFCPSSVEFPVLQSLTVASAIYDFKFEWFRMPQLRRLALIDVDDMALFRQFSLPEHSPLIDTIEVLSCDYRIFRDFFNPESSPLLPIRNSLERLTIMAGFEDAWGMPKWSLDFLAGMKQLCIPFVCFSRGHIENYPPNLAELALIGNSHNSYKEDEHVVSSGCLKLRSVLGSKNELGLGKLERLIVRVQGAEKKILRIKDVRMELGVDLGV